MFFDVGLLKVENFVLKVVPQELGPVFFEDYLLVQLVDRDPQLVNLRELDWIERVVFPIRLAFIYTLSVRWGLAYHKQFWLFESRVSL